MPQVADSRCPKCKEWNRVYVREDRMPVMQERFLYRCAKCGELVNDALGVFSPILCVPEGAVVAEKPSR